MTTIYVPRLIRTVEDAEALPLRTPIMVGSLVAWRPFADDGWAVTLADDYYATTAEFLDAFSDRYEYVALVPVEAREQFSGAIVSDAAEGMRWQGTRRLVTSWMPGEGER